MAKILIIFVAAVVLLLIAFAIKTSQKKEKSQIGNYQQTYATIDRVIFSDTGNAKYYVSFIEDGNKIIAQTCHYSSKMKSLNLGDTVKIGYFVAKNGAYRAVILDDRLIPVSSFVPRYYKFLTAVGLLLLLIAVIMFVREVVH